MTRHTTTGNAKPHLIATGYKHESPQYARWERPEGEPSLLVGVATFLGGILAIALVVTAIEHAPVFHTKPVCSEYCK